jgi:FMN-dependent NADH-azoreductase
VVASPCGGAYLDRVKTLLHLIATPRGEESRTLRVTAAFLEVFRQRHPDWAVDELNLATEPLPSLIQRGVDGRYVLLEGEELYGSLKESWEEVLGHIRRFLSADAYLLSVPMWNFSVPYVLKEYLDVIVQPRLSFRAGEAGIEGLARGRPLTVITSRGWDYDAPPWRGHDLQEPYLRLIFGFLGITDIEFIVAQPTDLGEKLREQRIREAQEAARALAARR